MSEPSFLDALAADAVLESGVLSEAVVGREAITATVSFVGSLYASKDPILVVANSVALVQYDATLGDRFKIHCVVVLTKDDSGMIRHVRTGCSPFEANAGSSPNYPIEEVTSAIKHVRKGGKVLLKIGRDA